MSGALGGLPDDGTVQLEVQVAAIIGPPELALLWIRRENTKRRLLQPVSLTVRARQGSAMKWNELPLRELRKFELSRWSGRCKKRRHDGRRRPGPRVRIRPPH